MIGPINLGHYGAYVKTLIGIIAIVNPLGCVPIFLALTQDKDESELRAIPRITSTTVFVVLTLVVWAGDMILKIFGVNIAAFQAGGGLLILLIAISMMHAKTSGAKHTDEEAQEAQDKEAIAVVPLAIPLLAGPGSISLVIINANQSPGIGSKIVLSGIILIVSIIIWLALRLAEPIGKKLGITGLNIATRIMGLILAGIAVQMITSGLKVLLPGLQ